MLASPCVDPREVPHDALLAPAGSEAVLALEEHASSGCSRCARSLVNGRDLGVDLAVASETTRPAAALRERVLLAARGALSPPRIATPARPIDPSGAVAGRHAGAPDEAARLREIATLDARTPRRSDELERLLLRVEALLGFPLHFVSIVDATRVAYRTERGLPEALSAFREIRREMTFCTHCVATGAPFVVEDASREAFFRASKMVTRYGMHAYLGVPLRTATGAIVGTLCALDFAPHTIAPSDVRVLELFAARAAAEIEWPRSRGARGALLEDAPNELHARPWFEALVAALRGRRAGLVRVRGAGAEAVSALIEPAELVGRLADSIAILLPDGTLIAERCASVRRSLESTSIEVEVEAVSLR